MYDEFACSVLTICRFLPFLLTACTRQNNIYYVYIKIDFISETPPPWREREEAKVNICLATQLQKRNKS